MGQREAIDFFKSNQNTFFSSKQVSQLLGLNRQRTITILNKICQEPGFIVKEEPRGQTNQMTKIYSFKEPNKWLAQALDSYKAISQDHRFLAFNGEMKLLFLAIAELKKLGEQK